MSRVVEKSAADARHHVELHDSDTDEGEAREVVEAQAEDTGDSQSGADTSRSQHMRSRRHLRAGRAVAGYSKAVMGGPLVKQLFLAAKPACTEEDLPHKAGWVQKVSSSWFRGFQSRWLVVENKQIRWYCSPDGKLRGVIDLSLLEMEVERLWTDGGNNSVQASKSGRGCCSGYLGGVSGPVSFRVCPISCNRAFEVQVPNLAEGSDWVDIIVKHVRAADACATRRIPRQVDDRTGRAWWKVQRISCSEFDDLANTGDVLLFRSRGVFGKLIRAAHLGARYDHVGLLVRMGDGSLGILEATGDRGVDILPWADFLSSEYQALYPEMALRRVHFPRDSTRLEALQTWCRDVVGKPYGLHIRKLTARRSFSAGGQDFSSDFFCSQLVADALKVLGVMHRGRSSTQYWPSSFSSTCKDMVECTPGCSCDSVDLIIDFKL